MTSKTMNDEFEQELREMIQAIGSIERFRPPAKGYLHQIRNWRGLTGAAVARKMSITTQSLAGIENSERKGRIQLDTLGVAAKALDCTVVYILVPNETIPQAPALPDVIAKDEVSVGVETPRPRSPADAARWLAEVIERAGSNPRSASEPLR